LGQVKCVLDLGCGISYSTAALNSIFPKASPCFGLYAEYNGDLTLKEWVEL